jgi:ferredoxin/flavodoxin---NADP+ reductase
MTEGQSQSSVAVIGAGPAGLYAARQFANRNIPVALLNRDIKPGGLAEYGIYYDKYKMKEGLRKQFRQILADERIFYFGNVTIGQQGDLTLNDLKEIGFQATLVTVGAQGTKWLGLPGEDLTGVYHAKDLVYHYNKLPPFSQQEYLIGRRVALIGVGNVMMDIAHWLVRDLQVDEVVAVARRGPAEVKFTRQEMENVGNNLDIAALDAEMERAAPVMRAINQDIQAARDFILSGLPKALPRISETRFYFDFLASPTRILGDEDGRVAGLEVEDTSLELRPDGDTKTKRLGTHRVLDVDTVVFCIGDRVDETFGLPVEWNEFVKHPEPRYPIDGNSYEAYDPETKAAIEGVFVAGWSRKASDGLVGVARKDGETGAKAVMQYLQSLRETTPAGAKPSAVLQRLEQRLKQLPHPVITKQDWQRLEAIERQIAQQQDLEIFKFSSNEEMLEALRRAAIYMP